MSQKKRTEARCHPNFGKFGYRAFQRPFFDLALTLMSMKTDATHFKLMRMWLKG
ncbi:MAG: hypothetical protein ACE5PV_06960 [Candidatus Poribacteria bacterium]